MNYFSDNPHYSSDSDTSSSKSWSIENPLDLHVPLGQDFLSPKFINPLGKKSISRLNNQIFTNNEFLVQNSFNNLTNFVNKQTNLNIDTTTSKSNQYIYHSVNAINNSFSTPAKLKKQSVYSSLVNQNIPSITEPDYLAQKELDSISDQSNVSDLNVIAHNNPSKINSDKFYPQFQRENLDLASHQPINSDSNAITHNDPAKVNSDKSSPQVQRENLDLSSTQSNISDSNAIAYNNPAKVNSDKSSPQVQKQEDISLASQAINSNSKAIAYNNPTKISSSNVSPQVQRENLDLSSTQSNISDSNAIAYNNPAKVNSDNFSPQVQRDNLDSASTQSNISDLQAITPNNASKVNSNKSFPQVQKQEDISLPSQANISDSNAIAYNNPAKVNSDNFSPQVQRDNLDLPSTQSNISDSEAIAPNNASKVNSDNFSPQVQREDKTSPSIRRQKVNVANSEQHSPVIQRENIVSSFTQSNKQDSSIIPSNNSGEINSNNIILDIQRENIDSASIKSNSVQLPNTIADKTDDLNSSLDLQNNDAQSIKISNLVSKKNLPDQRYSDRSKDLFYKLQSRENSLSASKYNPNIQKKTTNSKRYLNQEITDTKTPIIQNQVDKLKQINKQTIESSLSPKLDDNETIQTQFKPKATRQGNYISSPRNDHSNNGNKANKFDDLKNIFAYKNSKQISLYQSKIPINLDNKTVAQMLRESESSIQMYSVIKNISTIKPLHIQKTTRKSTQVANKYQTAIYPPAKSINVLDLSMKNNNLSSNIFRGKQSSKNDLPQVQMLQAPNITNTQQTPDSWSNIAELLGENSENHSDNSSSTLIQRKKRYQDKDYERKQKQDFEKQKHYKNQPELENWTVKESAFLPPGAWKNRRGITSLDLMGQPEAIKAKTQRNLEAKNKLKEATSNVSAKVIPPIYSQEVSTDGLANLPQVIIQKNNKNENIKQEKKADLSSVDTLAREVYLLIKQRIEVERERQGSDSWQRW